ncbi:LOW QUALITY PROTEIN: hypothetical protein BDA96_05G034400 [Sorghum bicolor]|uniref:Fungal lipase-type domain-containing protein n=1 Tax=Sorghum bicolor TaxID=4558 RepID=A0A921QX56_SORBI|nr:LOW QUALITY PROTEIN: hypothetical protein BDA96_05G034400 [Sorghum bicolor]
MAAAAASISGSRTCYPSGGVPMASGGRRRTVIRSSFAPGSPASTPSTVRIGSKWTELQGARDWDGLLSPLDGALRGELVRYGEFVRAAYASFDFEGGAPSYGSCRFPSRSLLRRAGMPGTGYRVTRLLHAASSCTASLRWWLPSSSPPPCGYIGFVAVCDDEREIERLGRRDVVVAFRGTATCGEWVDNFKSGLTRLPTIPTTMTGGGEDDGEEAMVERGFWRLFTAPGEAHSSLQQQVRDEARRIAHEYGGSGAPPLSITVTGHSLGAALAVLTAHEIATTQQQQQQRQQEDGEPAAMMVTAVSFGGPRVGNAAFRRRMEESGGKVLRVVNSDDIVTKVPGFPVHEQDGGGHQPAKGMMKARLPRWLVAKMGWAYADVGRELRLSQAGSPPNVVASHDLDLYLKLVASCTD